MTRQVIVYRDEEGYWIADVPSLPGCHTYAESRADALEQIRAAMRDHFAMLQANNLAIPDDPCTAEIILVDA